MGKGSSKGSVNRMRDSESAEEVDWRSDDGVMMMMAYV